MNFKTAVPTLGLILVSLSCQGPAQIVRYELKGKIVVHNDCDGLQASIPAQVKVKSSLNDNQGQFSGGNTTANLAPDPNDPAAPKKIGEYSIKVAWGPGFGNPQTWDQPKVTSNRRPVCRVINNCPTPGSRCTDQATASPTVPFVNPVTTNDIRISCSCVGP